MVKPPKDYLNLLGMYFGQNTVTYGVSETIRPSVFTERKVDLPLSWIEEARREISKVESEIDELTPEFAQDLNGMIFGEDKVRALLIIKGDLVGRGTEIRDTIIPINLGTNPWSLYQGSEGYDTIDARLTSEQAAAYLMQNANELARMGLQQLVVNESSFHYARDSDLKEKFPDGKGDVDLADLTRYLVDTYGYAGVDGVIKPSEQEFNDKAMTVTSYRQKQSLEEKTIRELCQKDPFRDVGDVITDWGAHRVVFATEEEARSFGTRFRRAYSSQNRVEIGKFGARVLHVDDYYTDPKKSGFSSYNVAANVISTRRRFEEVVREIQIYHWNMHFKGQINESDPAFHRTIRERQLKAGSARRKVMERFEYDHFIRGMFATEPLIITNPL
jgi:hypothetical protein